MIGDALIGGDLEGSGGPVCIVRTARDTGENHGKPELLKPVLRSKSEPGIFQIQT
jgi:hypothetical protein